VLGEDLAQGEVTALLVLGHELELGPEPMERAARLDTLVVIADTEEGIAARARVGLPSAAWAEVTGTITNRQGLVQRMHPAFAPPGQALPAWEIITRLGQASGAALGYGSVRQVFDEMVGKVGELQGQAARWGREARPIQLRFANSRG
jgi:NADH-quinone oxidoreductase subunit G